MTSIKRPKDTNQRAKFIVELATGGAVESTNNAKNKAAVENGRLGGLKGGKSRAKKLSAKKRKEIAKKAAKKRWGKNK